MKNIVVLEALLIGEVRMIKVSAFTDLFETIL